MSDWQEIVMTGLGLGGLVLGAGLLKTAWNIYRCDSRNWEANTLRDNGSSTFSKVWWGGGYRPLYPGDPRVKGCNFAVKYNERGSRFSFGYKLTDRAVMATVSGDECLFAEERMAISKLSPEERKKIPRRAIELAYDLSGEKAPRMFEGDDVIDVESEDVNERKYRKDKLLD